MRQKVLRGCESSPDLYLNFLTEIKVVNIQTNQMNENYHNAETRTPQNEAHMTGFSIGLRLKK